MRLPLLLVLLLLASAAFSQRTDSLKQLYTNQTIYRYGKNFMKGTDRLGFGELQSEFSFSPLGLESYAMAGRYRRTSTLLKVLSVVAGAVTISMIASNQNLDNFYYGLGAQIGLGIAGQIYHNLSNQQTDRALWQRNKDLLFGQ